VLRGGASIPNVGVEPKSTALPQEGQKRAAPGTSLPQAGQLMIVAGVYHRPLPSSDSAERSLPRNGVQPAGKVPRCYRGPSSLGVGFRLARLSEVGKLERPISCGLKIACEGTQVYPCTSPSFSAARNGAY
jgi:hypothetical protein